MVLMRFSPLSIASKMMKMRLSISSSTSLITNPANTYGTAMPLKMDLDRQILSRGTQEKKRLAMENSSSSSELQKLIEAIKILEYEISR
ncbi:hypothetical protein V6Z12_D04G123000 [Gossypium hirsutum]